MGLIGDIKIRYSTLFYEKIPRLSGSTVPLGIRRMKTPPRKRGGGVIHPRVIRPPSV